MTVISDDAGEFVKVGKGRAKAATERAEVERLAATAVPELLPAVDDGPAPWDNPA